MRRARGWLLTPILAGLVLALAACGSQAPRFKYYVLTPLSGSVAAAPEARAVSVGVGPVRLPGYLDRPQIVTRRGSDEIDLGDLDRWGEALADGVPRAIAGSIGALLPSARIALFPWAGTVQYQVMIDVNRFDGALGGEVVLDARWRIVGPDRKDVVDRRFAAREPVGAATYAAQVAAMSRALEALSREIAGALAAVAPRASTPSARDAG
jgi:uncharacterized lipoprotein YmbA